MPFTFFKNIAKSPLKTEKTTNPRHLFKWEKFQQELTEKKFLFLDREGILGRKITFQ
jgi:hypothetical protein